jgi:hypothetical protein
MAETRTITIELPFTTNDDGTHRVAKLELTTEKAYSGGIESKAYVFWHGTNSRQHAFGLCRDGSGDFAMTITKTDRTVRATQKAIDTQHAAVFTTERIAKLSALATAHYLAQGLQKAS